MASCLVAVYILQLVLYSTFLGPSNGHVTILLPQFVPGLANLVRRLQSELILYERHMLLALQVSYTFPPRQPR